MSAANIFTVEYRKDGNLYFRNSKLELPAVREELGKWNREKPGGVILLKISGELPYEKAVTLIDAVKSSGDNRFSLRMI